MQYKSGLRFLIITLLSSTAFFATPEGLSMAQTMAKKLTPFTSDGCSLFPDGTTDAPSLWVHCCIQHDLAYWAGGTRAKKRQADHALAQCVKQTGQSHISQLMHSGVAFGGSAYYPTFYRWGYGWPYLRGYKALTPTEKAAVIEQLHTTQRYINDYLRVLTATSTP